MEYIHLRSTLPHLCLEKKRVFLRVDYNVPVLNTKIIDDYKITATLPTLHFLLEKNAQIVLATHRGNPAYPCSELSTRILLEWFLDKGYRIQFAPTIEAALALLNDGFSLVLLENLRFFPQEIAHDALFAQQLALLAEYYINDAFGVLHRNDTSLALTAFQFSSHKRAIGFLVEKELQNLSKVCQNNKPYLLFLGGAKATDKIPLIEKMLSKVTDVLLGPALCFTFLKALNQPVGNSIVDLSMIAHCTRLIQHAQKYNVSIHLPIDFLVQNTKTGNFKSVEREHISHDEKGISIGPKTIIAYTQHCVTAKTIIYNGLMGFLDQPNTLKPVHELFNSLVNTKAFSVIAGGDSVAAAHSFKLCQKNTYYSTGGGSTLQYLTGDPLPGLAPFYINYVNKRDKNSAN